MFVAGALNPLYVTRIIVQCKSIQRGLTLRTAPAMTVRLSARHLINQMYGQFEKLDQDRGGTSMADVMFTAMCYANVAAHRSWRTHVAINKQSVDSVWRRIILMAIEWSLMKPSQDTSDWASKTNAIVHTMLRWASYLIVYVYACPPKSIKEKVSNNYALIKKNMLSDLTRIVYHCSLDEYIVRNSSITDAKDMKTTLLLDWLYLVSKSIKPRDLHRRLWEYLSPTGCHARTTRMRNAGIQTTHKIYNTLLIGSKEFKAFNLYTINKTVAQLMNPIKLHLENKSYGRWAKLTQQYAILYTFTYVFESDTKDTFLGRYWVPPPRIDAEWKQLFTLRSYFTQHRCPIIVRLNGCYCLHTATRALIRCKDAAHAICTWLAHVRDKHMWLTNNRESVHRYSKYI